MDSCVTTAIAAQTHTPALMHVNYRQRTQTRELQAFNEIAEYYNVPAVRRLVVDIDHLYRIGGSSLTDTSLDVPAAELERREIPNSYVPFRNANLLAMAVSWAEVVGAAGIYIGAVEEDSSGYPDCRQVFFDAFNRVIELGTRPETHISIVTPVINMKKHEIVRTGVELGAPLHLSWSCYQSESKACGRCDSCMLRKRAFKQAGVEDPVEYE